MNTKLKVKQNIKQQLLKHPSFFWCLYVLKSLLVDFKGREYRKRYGMAYEYVTFYVIRPRTNSIEGLMSLLIWVLKKAEYAERKGYIPIVDMLNYNTQYSDGKTNIWNWFFNNKLNYSLKDIYNSKNVILSGYKLIRSENDDICSTKIFYDADLKIYCRNLSDKYFLIHDDAIEIYKKELSKIPIEKCIGVFLRGTDYIKLKPIGEAVQPTASMVLKKVKEFRNRYNNAPIFLVTEDQNIYEKMRKYFKNEIYIVSFDTFIENYQGRDFLSKENVLNKNKHELGVQYLTKILLLSKCRYFIASIACGSKIAYMLKKGKFDDEYIFNLGIYGEKK